MKNQEFYSLCISMIENIDIYLRQNNDIEEYDDFHPFINEEDFILYRDFDFETISSLTLSIFSKIIPDINKVVLNSNNKQTIFYLIIASYVLFIKYYTDCSADSSYSIIIDILRELDDISKISKKFKNRSHDKDIVKKLIDFEWFILNTLNFNI